MKIAIKGFIYHKAAEKYHDCFDRLGFSKQTNKFAISDGVSKSFMPGIWAELLIGYFLKGDDQVYIGDVDSYRIIQREWAQTVEEIVNKPNQKYFVRNFYSQGRSAAATFVGLHFLKENGKLRWRAVALGDSFLFFVPKAAQNLNEDFEKITYLSSKTDFKFDNFPDFFDSRSSYHKGRIKIKSNLLQSGTFYLLTDALSEWFIAKKQEAVDIISTWATQQDFEKSIIELRKSELNNDDSTILVITIEEDDTNEINYTEINITNIEYLLNKESDNYIQNNLKESLNIITKNNADTDGEILPSNNDFEKDDDIEKNLNKENFSPETLIDEHNLEKEKSKQNEDSKTGFWERNVSKLWNYWGNGKYYYSDEFYDYDYHYEERVKRKKEKKKRGGDNKNKMEESDDVKKGGGTQKDIAKSIKEQEKDDNDISSITDKF